MEEKTDQLP